jgi:GNAT superfamily N-acetyltransferase
VSDDGAQTNWLAELRFGEAPDTQNAAGAAVDAIAASTGVAPGRLTAVRAVVEALVLESRERPRAPQAPADVTVRVAAHGGKLEVEVGDLALPVTARESRRARSRRLAALGFVDELHIGAHGRSGNVAAFTVALDPERRSLHGERVAEDAPAASDEEAEALEIRRMREQDAAELVRCVYRCYGYSYKDPLLYEPREIAKALRRGTMTSVVAAAPDGTIAGHSAVFVERAGDPIPESGRLVVDPRYRGHGVATRLAALRKELAAQDGVEGFWSEAVTNHVASQREVLAAGGSEVGLLIGASPAAVAMAGFENENRGRRTLMAMFTPIRRIPATIHVPERHAGFVAALFERLEAERAIETGAADAAAAESALSTSVRPDVGLANLRVQRVGGDLAARAADALDGFAEFELGAVHLDLPLADPAAASAATELEPLGFSFGALIPKFDEGSDILRLQRVGDLPVETERLAVARPEGEQVRDYVLADWQRVRRGGRG